MSGGAARDQSVARKEGVREVVIGILRVRRRLLGGQQRIQQYATQGRRRVGTE